MRRTEIAILRSPAFQWARLTEILPRALESCGLDPDESGADGALTVYDRGDSGCILAFERGNLARRVARALATRAAAKVEIFEVTGTQSPNRNRFHANAHVALASGDLKDAEGKELDFEDPAEKWGGGTLQAQGMRVMEEFSQEPSFARGAVRTVKMGFKQRPAGRPSSPRVSQLLGLLKLAKSHTAVPKDGGRVELHIELATGGKQVSYCSAAEHEELERLFVG